MLARKLDYPEYDYTAYETYEDTVYTEPSVRQKPRAVYTKNLRCEFSILVGIVLFFAFFLVARGDVSIRKGYELVAAQRQENELIKNNEHLKVHLAGLKAPERITGMALQIGMIPADKNIYVKAGPSGQTAPKEDKLRMAWKKD